MPTPPSALFLPQARTAARTASQASRSMHTTAVRQGGHGGDYVRCVIIHSRAGHCVGGVHQHGKAGLSSGILLVELSQLARYELYGHHLRGVEAGMSVMWLCGVEVGMCFAPPSRKEVLFALWYAVACTLTFFFRPLAGCVYCAFFPAGDVRCRCSPVPCICLFTVTLPFCLATAAGVPACRADVLGPAKEQGEVRSCHLWWCCRGAVHPILCGAVLSEKGRAEVRVVPCLACCFHAFGAMDWGMAVSGE